MHARGLGPRGVQFHLAIPMKPVLPSVGGTTSAPRRLVLSRLNTRPTLSPVNASGMPSRAYPHDSGPVWVASPSLYGTFIRSSLPVLIGAYPT